MKKPNSNEAESTYNVGYGKPPKANQFRKGRTGNPRGKRRGEDRKDQIQKLCRSIQMTSPRTSSASENSHIVSDIT